MGGKVQVPKILLFFSSDRGYSNLSFSGHMTAHMET